MSSEINSTIHIKKKNQFKSDKCFQLSIQLKNSLFILFMFMYSLKMSKELIIG